MPNRIKSALKLMIFITGAAALTLVTACSAAAPPATQNSTVSPAKSLAGGTISLAADLSAIKSGTAFNVDVVINTTSPLRGAQWSLKFDPAVMKCESFEEGTFFKYWAAANSGSTLLFPQPVIDNQAGTVSDCGIAIMAKTSGGATGQGVAGVYHFSALVDSVKLPELLKAKAADEKGNMFSISSK